ncbi:unnamed protein product [Musa acuminata subsp. malaccensis]|uniref:(wild Malaysian banana) hypothetical protein n=1 Tax=Musa acuminata subsp. malaccensis TaxID=214687 RepID=A0A804L9G8_MUSAM|nr:PREDICTED: uncharacterized protein LOC103971981 [Musa acuminata subsp. malaccensis]XP_018676345.1 PREDICTED: uncharacterized protein LOC103971981 [Musa acuminata subsp. malaccensis]CAG1865030.1 unnamed protein product [Musa acuminata subsp. malaccensis]
MLLGLKTWPLRSLPSSLRFLSFSTPARLLQDPSPISPSDLESLVLRQYRAGKFHNLLPYVVATPSVLLAATGRLLSRANPSIPTPSLAAPPFSVDALADELGCGGFDPAAHCATLIPSRKKGEALTLPDLKLKVVVEAVRMALEVVYGKRFATFAYGGRESMGRHTAVRYLKTTVQNPTWWFPVALRREPFGTRHLRRLVAILEEKIEDPALVALVERLFGSQTISIEFGGVQLGRGFPQESDLSAIILNIYLDALDREIKDLRAEIHKKNPRLGGLEENETSGVFHKPIRVYAVRYLDEILLATSGSKLFTMNVKDRILKVLEDNLELKVDKLKTSIHSAVSEKMNFLGMELQAVPPSVLHPPMSEKAIRAKKKYLKRKAAKAQELKNARETRRKKLGLKILNHLFKKLKRGHEFEFDFRIESEVREVFANWAHEVVAEYFKSREDCWHWHRMLSTGDFLSLKRIRDQLPHELVDSYDHFQEKLDKYLMPIGATRDVEEEERLAEEEEERKYAKRTVEDLTELRMRVNAPLELVRKAVKLAGFTNSMGRPRPIKLLICLDDADIIKWYAGVGRRWLEFFCCCRNFKMVKTIVTYHLRFSCFLTLAEKHEATKRQAISHYTKDLKVTDVNGMEAVHFPTEREVKMMGDQNLSDPKPVDGALTLILARLATNEFSFPCLAHFCGQVDTVLYRIRLLQNRLNVDPLNKSKWVPGMGAIHESLNKKCLPLCSKHASDLLLGKISLQDIDCTSFVDM